MNKFELVQEEIAKGGSYQLELLKLLCEIDAKLENITKPPEVMFIEEKKEEQMPIKSVKKRGRPPKKGR